MTDVVLDQSIRARLHNLTEQLELKDEEGRTLAYCLPADVYRDLLVQLSRTQVSDEELDRRRGSERWYTTAEVQDHLRSL